MNDTLLTPPPDAKSASRHASGFGTDSRGNTRAGRHEHRVRASARQRPTVTVARPPSVRGRGACALVHPWVPAGSARPVRNVRTRGLPPTRTQSWCACVPQPIEASGDERLDSGWNLNVCGGFAGVPATITRRTNRGHHSLRRLWTPAPSRVPGGWKSGAAGQRIEHVGRRSARQSFNLECARVDLSTTPTRTLLQQLRSRGAEQHQGHTTGKICDVHDQIEQSRLCPVNVLNDDNQRRL